MLEVDSNRVTDPSYGEARLGYALIALYAAFGLLAYSFDTFMQLFDAGTDRFWRVNTATWQGVALYYFSIAEQIECAVLVSLIVTGPPDPRRGVSPPPVRPPFLCHASIPFSHAK